MAEKIITHIDRLKAQLEVIKAMESPSSDYIKLGDLLEERIAVVETATIGSKRYSTTQEIYNDRKGLATKNCAIPLDFMHSDPKSEEYLRGKQQLFLSDLRHQYDADNIALVRAIENPNSTKEDRIVAAKIIQYDSNIDRINKLPEKSDHLTNLKAAFENTPASDEVWRGVLKYRIEAVEASKQYNQNEINKILDERLSNPRIDQPLAWLVFPDENKNEYIKQLKDMDIARLHDPYNHHLIRAIIDPNVDKEKLHKVIEVIKYDAAVDSSQAIIESVQNNLRGEYERIHHATKDWSGSSYAPKVSNIAGNYKESLYAGDYTRISYEFNNGNIVSVNEYNKAIEASKNNIDKSVIEIFKEQQHEYDSKSKNSPALNKEATPTDRDMGLIKKLGDEYLASGSKQTGNNIPHKLPSKNPLALT